MIKNKKLNIRVDGDLLDKVDDLRRALRGLPSQSGVGRILFNWAHDALCSRDLPLTDAEKIALMDDLLTREDDAGAK